jgi:hypothetical protein
MMVPQVLRASKVILEQQVLKDLLAHKAQLA